MPLLAFGIISESLTQDVLDEATRAHDKHGQQSMLYGSEDKSLRILIEEVGEVAREMNELALGNQDNDTYVANARKELIQVAAMAITWAEKLGRWHNQ